MIKVYVTAPTGLYIFGEGHRNYGEFFFVAADLASEIENNPNLSLEDPQKPKSGKKVKETTPDVRSE